MVNGTKSSHLLFICLPSIFSLFLAFPTGWQKLLGASMESSGGYPRQDPTSRCLFSSQPKPFFSWSPLRKNGLWEVSGPTKREKNRGKSEAKRFVLEENVRFRDQHRDPLPKELQPKEKAAGAGLGFGSRFWIWGVSGLVFLLEVPKGHRWTEKCFYDSWHSKPTCNSSHDTLDLRGHAQCV